MAPKAARPKAFAYLRVSGKGQVRGDGFTRQLQAIRAYAKQQGIRITQVFREEGVSGTTDLAMTRALGPDCSPPRQRGQARARREAGPSRP